MSSVVGGPQEPQNGVSAERKARATVVKLVDMLYPRQ